MSLWHFKMDLKGLLIAVIYMLCIKLCSLDAKVNKTQCNMLYIIRYFFNCSFICICFVTCCCSWTERFQNSTGTCLYCHKVFINHIPPLSSPFSAMMPANLAVATKLKPIKLRGGWRLAESSSVRPNGAKVVVPGPVWSVQVCMLHVRAWHIDSFFFCLM